MLNCKIIPPPFFSFLFTRPCVIWIIFFHFFSFSRGLFFTSISLLQGTATPLWVQCMVYKVTAWHWNLSEKQKHKKYGNCISLSSGPEGSHEIGLAEWLAPIQTILNAGHWNNSCTFAKFDDKAIYYHVKLWQTFCCLAKSSFKQSFANEALFRSSPKSKVGASPVFFWHLQYPCPLLSIPKIPYMCRYITV